MGALLALSVGLSMDAFAVALCKGLALGRVRFRQGLAVGLWFGFFQGLMPCVGFLLGSSVGPLFSAFDHWIAAGLLGFIGVNMLREALWGDGEGPNGDLSFRAMAVLAIATSVDALVAGISMTAMDLPYGIFIACGFIVLVTFCLSFLGTMLGARVSARTGPKAELLGGIILLFLAGKILSEHLA